METIFAVKSGTFEGPLDLLLDLIEKRKLHISDVSLSAIADDYMAHVEKLSEFPMADTASFVLIASTLVLIKSKSLLPTLTLSEDEQGSIDDLELRLKIYKEFREISKKIENIFGRNIIYSGLSNKRFDPIFSPPPGLNIDQLKNAMHDVLKNLPIKDEPVKTTVRKIISLEEMMESLSQRIQSGLKLSFKNFANKEERMNAIVGFLAMLELVKRGIIAVRQDKNFEDIEMAHNTPGTPNYS